GRGFRQAEAADLLERFYLPVREGHDAHAGARLARASIAAAAAARSALRRLRARFGSRVGVRGRFLFFFRLRLRDREDHELAGGREGRGGPARVLEFLAAAEVADDELAVVPLRR